MNRPQPARTSSLPAFDKPPLFIGGAGRSGTSLLRTILNAHSNIAVGNELKVTPILAQTYHRVIQLRAHLEDEFYLTTPEIDGLFGNLIRAFLEKFHEQSGKPRVGEKTPNNVFILHILHRLFPCSPLIHIMRDGRDVVRSLLQCNWSNSGGSLLPITQDVSAAAAYWRRAVTAGRSAAEQPSVKSRYIEIRYEKLVCQPAAVIRQLLSSIDEPWDPAVLSFHEKEESLNNSVHRPISARSVGRWKEELTDSQRAAIKEVAGDLLIELGYAEDYDW